MTYEKILEKLKAVRQDRGISVRKLGQLSGVSPTSISFVETGQNKLGLEHF